MLCRRILAVIDPETEHQPALQRALTLARHTSGEVVAFLCIYDFSYEMTTLASSEERESMRNAVIADRLEWLEGIIGKHTDISITPVVVWETSLHHAVLHYTVTANVDIILKYAHSHDDLASLIFTPTDWHILRKSPVPVLMVKQHDWPVDGNIIAAVNIGTDDKEHELLNTKVVETGKQFCDLLGGHLHLVNAFPGAAMNLAIEIPEFDPHGYTANVQQHHQQAMQTFALQHSVYEQNCHVVQGLPETAIPVTANQVDAELVVLGTIGRVGLSAAIIGNTAEQVIDALNCDVLAIKPDGFSSSFN